MFGLTKSDVQRTHGLDSQVQETTKNETDTLFLFDPKSSAPSYPDFAFEPSVCFFGGILVEAQEENKRRNHKCNPEP